MGVALRADATSRCFRSGCSSDASRQAIRPCPLPTHSQCWPPATLAAFYRRSTIWGPAAFCGRTLTPASNSLIGPKIREFEFPDPLWNFPVPDSREFSGKPERSRGLLALGEGQMCVEGREFPVLSHITGKYPLLRDWFAPDCIIRQRVNANRIPGTFRSSRTSSANRKATPWRWDNQLLRAAVPRGIRRNESQARRSAGAKPISEASTAKAGAKGCHYRQRCRQQAAICFGTLGLVFGS